MTTPIPKEIREAFSDVTDKAAEDEQFAVKVLTDLLHALESMTPKIPDPRHHGGEDMQAKCVECNKIKASHEVIGRARTWLGVKPGEQP